MLFEPPALSGATVKRRARLRTVSVVGTFTVRDAELADLEAVREVFRRSSLSNEGDRAHLLANPEVLEFSDLSILERRIRVAVAGDQIVGFATTVDTDTGLELDDLFVDPSWMGKGVGRRLLRGGEHVRAR